MGDYDNALGYHFKSLTVELKTCDENHPDVGSSYNNIGSVYKEKSEYDNALEYYTKSLSILNQRFRCIIIMLLPAAITSPLCTVTRRIMTKLWNIILNHFPSNSTLWTRIILM